MAAAAERHLIYVATPGIRNYMSYGGIGVLVYDASRGYALVETHPDLAGAASGSGGRERQGHRRQREDRPALRQHASSASAASISLTEKMVWDQPIEGGAIASRSRRTARSLYVPSFEGPHWNVVDAMTGDDASRRS